MTALRRAPSLVTGFHELSSNRSVLGGGIVSRMFSESNASTSGSLPCNTRNFSARARAPREFEPRSPQEMGYSQRFSLNYREIAEQKHAERLEDTGVRAVLQEEYAGQCSHLHTAYEHPVFLNKEWTTSNICSCIRRRP